MCAYPTSIVMPRRCSSGRRSASIPVSARSSVVLPWSMWPAVPTTTVTGGSAARSRRTPTRHRAPFAETRTASAIVVRGIDGPQVEHDRAVRRPGRPRAGRAARQRAPAAGPATRTASDSPRAAASARQRAAADGQRRVRRSTGATGRPAAATARRARARLHVGERRRRSAPDGHLAAPRAPARYRASVAASAARIALSGRIARASGSRRRRATRSARPTTSPACGPPSSLSPLNVTRSAPSASRSARRRLVGEAERRRVQQRAAAEVVHDDRAVRVRQRRDLGRRRAPRRTRPARSSTGGHAARGARAPLCERRLEVRDARAVRGARPRPAARRRAA